MSENRPTEWQWREPHDGLIDGLTREEWEAQGVEAWATKMTQDRGALSTAPAGGLRGFFADVRYAPATLEGLPAAWPARMDWQWRKLDADMGERTWRAMPYWAHAGYVPEYGTVNGPDGGIWESSTSRALAKAGEWWAPADQDGHPCAWPELEPRWRRVENGRIDGLTQQEWSARGVAHWCGLSGRSGVTVGEAGGIWHFTDGAEYAPMLSGDAPAEWPELEPQPVVVIPAAEMTARVRYGHVALGGTWRCAGNGYNFEWVDDGAEIGEGEQWTPCDKHGNFCELRRVVDALAHDALSAERYHALAAAEKERDELKAQYHEWRDRARRLNALLHRLHSLGEQAERAWDGGEQ